MEYENNKHGLRKKFQKINQALTPKYLKSSEKIIDRKVEWFIENYHLQSICLYWSYGTEVATQNIIKFALKHGVKVYLPVILDQKNMAFYEIKSLKDVEKSSFKFKEPKENPERLLTSVKEVQAIFVPLVAFDKDLNRLGKGQGYYDRWFNTVNFTGYKIGLAREINLSEQLIDTENFDVRLDFIITDENLYVQLGEQDAKDFDVTYWRLNES